MVKYDPKILQKYAEMLYANARSIVFTATVIAVLLGIGPGVVVGKAVALASIPPADQSTVVALLALVVVFVFGVIGYCVGQSIAFWIRLKARRTKGGRTLYTREENRDSRQIFSCPGPHNDGENN